MTVGNHPLDAIRDLLDSQGWDTMSVDGAPAVQAAFRGDSAEWYCQAWWLDDVERFIFYSIAPLPIPLDRCDAAMRYLTRINVGLTVGNFELDLDDGAVRMKTSLAVSPIALDGDLIERQTESNLATMDHFMPGLLRVAFGDGDPDAEATLATTFDDE